MPSRPLRPCPVSNCPELVEKGRCPTHERQADRSRGTAQQRGYSYGWAKYSARFRRTHPLCGDKDADAYLSTASQCRREGRVSASVVTHHIRPHRPNPELFMDHRNHEALCERCHNAVVDEGDFGR
jgi:5-methylcytosine-specific restriction endonuclease McrA